MLAQELKKGREIIGMDIIMPEEIEDAVEKQLFYSQEQLEKLSLMLPRELALEMVARYCYENSVVILCGPPVQQTLKNIYMLDPDVFSPSNSWWEKESFTKEFIGWGWYAVWKKGIPKSKGRSWHSAVKLLRCSQKPLSATQMAWMEFVYQKVKGESLFQESFRTSSLEDDGDRICFDNNNGIEFFSTSDNKLPIVAAQEIDLFKQQEEEK